MQDRDFEKDLLNALENLQTKKIERKVTASMVCPNCGCWNDSQDKWNGFHYFNCEECGYPYKG